MTGRLLFGVPYNGTLHFDFQVHLLTLGDECQAVEIVNELGITPESERISDKMLIELAYLSQQLHIDGIAQSELTPAFLLDNLTPSDYDVVLGALNDLKKKRISVGGNPTVAS